MQIHVGSPIIFKNSSNSLRMCSNSSKLVLQETNKLWSPRQLTHTSIFLLQEFEGENG